MPGISKVNSNTSSGSSGISKKISFDVGDTFSARIVSGEDGGSEVTLKTSDGWSFKARVENSNDINDNNGQPAKFVVTGLEDGQIKIKFVSEETISDNTAKSKDFIGDLIKELGLSKSDVDEDVLKLMIKYNMPLTKENISKMETIVDFNEKLSGDSEQTNEFIAKYLSNKNIAQDSEEGIQITNTLKSLAENLKGMTAEDMFTLMENNIDITPENIESYKKLFKSDSSIYDELKEIEKNLPQNSKSNNVNSNNVNSKIADIDLKGEMSSSIGIKEAIQKHNDEAIQNESEEDLSGVKLKSQDENIDKLQSNLKMLDSMKEVLNRNGLSEVTVSGQKVNTNDIISKYVAQNWKGVVNDTKEQTINNLINKISEQTGISKERLSFVLKDFINDNKNVDTSQVKDTESKIALDDAVIKAQDENLQNLVKNADSEKQNGVLNKNILNEDVPKTVADSVKEQINLKINDMKDIINKLLTPSDNKDLNIQQKISLMLKNNMNDFKMFNSISGEYYYMDVPVNNNNQDYQCKLIIKDDRKSGKRIDSKNVKIVTSVKTINIGVVDAYIAVLNNNMNVNIKCDKEWVSSLDRAKIDIVKKISEMGYNINMTVQKKKNDSEEVNLVECRDFFNDNKYFKIDTRV
ncbi:MULTISPECIES: hypothetical protein [Clostridium]|uniref:hypothetical protein n=1 Tax=Clostridium TaxID=1485 RepID=UPI0008245FC0|nr:MULTISPECIES: hypothetical protein [Clostridium]PJI07716.1 hypothetical protein CUB90_07505 [Clostridium sp. CT7]